MDCSNDTTEHSEKKHLSYEERHADVEKREVFGHWEADLLTGPKSGYDAVLLVMVESKSRNYLVMRVKDKTAESVMQVFTQFCYYYGAAFGSYSKQLTPTTVPNSLA